MLEIVDLEQTVSKEAFKQRSKELKPALAALSQPIKQQKLPVIILFEGWGAAGKGSMISNLIVNFDPRGYQVHSIIGRSDEEKREPVMWRHWLKIPEQGIMSVLDRSWYQDVSVSRLERGLDDKGALRRMDDINIFERQLTDNGYLIIKFFLHITQKEQKERFEKLSGSKSTAWRVTDNDWKRNRQYDKFYSAFDEMLEYTDTAYAPWHVVSGMDKNAATLEVYSTVLNSISRALKEKADKEKAGACEPEIIVPGDYNYLPMPKLADVPLDQTITEEKYEKQLKKLQTKLSEQHGKLYSKKIPVILAFEGWDAAGKGGTIRRVSEALDSRGCEVIPVASPSREELARHYLWRFWRKLPKDGHVAIYDRTWYGRVMVERIEGFCATEDWQRAYREINEFEHQLTDWGAIVIKFWLQIDKDEQLKRFTARQNTPSKQWKITAEDWRNRDKWDLYEPAVNDMLQNTSTAEAPWHIITSQNKKYARIQTLKIIIDAIEKRLDE